jgi:dihydropteroate synthase
VTPCFIAASLPRRAVMGVVNVTPDSFSDGGNFLAPDAAIAHGRALARAGAAVLDVGGESTRPGAEPVDADEEARRVLPVVRALAGDDAAYVSIDTTKAAVARAALEAGATIVNDVSGGTADASMLSVVAEYEAGFVAMHMQGTPRTMQQDPSYTEVVLEVGEYLRGRVGAAIAAGVHAAAILVDPGIGFGKTLAHNLALLRALPRVAAIAGAPVVVGASRKSFLGTLLGGVSVDERDEATLAVSVWSFHEGAAMVRVHDVAGSVRAAAFLDALERSTPAGMVAGAA